MLDRCERSQPQRLLCRSSLRPGSWLLQHPLNQTSSSSLTPGCSWLAFVRTCQRRLHAAPRSRRRLARLRREQVIRREPRDLSLKRRHRYRPASHRFRSFRSWIWCRMPRSGMCSCSGTWATRLLRCCSCRRFRSTGLRQPSGTADHLPRRRLLVPELLQPRSSATFAAG